jgi:hypothetical protein
MIKFTSKWQLIHAGPGYLATKAAGITMVLTKGGCLGHRKHLLALREKWGSSGIVSRTKERLHRSLGRSWEQRIEVFGV